MLSIIDTPWRAPRPGDSGTVTIAFGAVDLGHGDRPVSERADAERSDFVRTATILTAMIRTTMRNRIEGHAGVTRPSGARRWVEPGLRRDGGADGEAHRDAGPTLPARPAVEAALSDRLR